MLKILNFLLLTLTLFLHTAVSLLIFRTQHDTEMKIKALWDPDMAVELIFRKQFYHESINNIYIYKKAHSGHVKLSND